MKNDLTCPVVRDLLPACLEGLTAPETNQAVDRHLAECPDCAALRSAMAAPGEEPPAEAAREVDYLKTVKRRGRRRMVLAAVCAVAAVMVFLAVDLFFIGEPIGAAVMSSTIDYDREEQVLHLQVHAVESAIAYKNWAVRQEGDTVRVTARKVAVSPFYSDGSYETDISVADGVRNVYLGETLIWQDGVFISRNAAALYAAQTPYVGDPSALGRITGLLRDQGRLSGWAHNSLQTAQEPYEWTLVYSDEVFSAVREAELNRQMEQLAPVLLALVDNLGVVSWTYRTQDGLGITGKVTLAEADGALPELAEAYRRDYGFDVEPRESVKDYLDSAAAFQELWNMAGLQ